MAQAVAIGYCLCHWIAIHPHPTIVAEFIEVALAIKREVFAVKLIAKAATFDTARRAGFVSRFYVAHLLACGGYVLVVESRAGGAHLCAWHSRAVDSCRA